MKQIVIAGRMGKDAELRRTQGGDPVLSFSVAVDDGFGENKTTIWFDTTVWGKHAEALGNLGLKKGTALTVAGDLSTREHEGRTYLKVNASKVTLQGGGEQRPARTSSQTPKQQSYAEASGGRVNEDLDDDLPF